MVLRLAVLAALCVLLSCVGAPPVPCTECAGVCVWVQTDPAHCGGCGKTCISGQLCKAGACVATCAAPQLACAGKCVDVKNDAANCGTCGTACGAAEFCSMGACASISACATGQVSCSGVCTTTATDQANCGACGNACAAGTGCSAGLCAVSCTGSLTKCSPDAGVTCANLQTDNANCGGCGVACAAGRACVAGSCQATCTVGLTSCPSGCANFANDSLNCGACGVVCDELSKCTNGGCVDPFAVPRLCSQLPPDSGIPNDGGFVRRTVYAFGRSDAPLPVRCGLDGGTWLELQNDGGLGNNFSRRAPGGFFTVGPEVVTRYSAVRIDYRFPNELLISNVDDRTFAVSTGSQTQGNSNNPARTPSTR